MAPPTTRLIWSLIIAAVGVGTIFVPAMFTIQPLPAGMEEIGHGDAFFWFQQTSFHGWRPMSCNVYYTFDKPVDENLLRKRLDILVMSTKAMMRRNVVEVAEMPYWQIVDLNLSQDAVQHFRVLEEGEDIEEWREQAEKTVSIPSIQGQEGALFRCVLTQDRKTWLFVWSHAISDVEGMLNLHAKHIFQENRPRTQHGYQLPPLDKQAAPDRSEQPLRIARNLHRGRSKGVQNGRYNVTRLELPLSADSLRELGTPMGLSVSDIFGFVSMRSALRYQEASGQSAEWQNPISVPVSLRQNASFSGPEGNHRAIKFFGGGFGGLPLEDITASCNRVRQLPSPPISYEEGGRTLMRLVALGGQKWKNALLYGVSPDYVSNFFPIADHAFFLGDVKVTHHNLRIPLVSYERTKFAWSSYDGASQLFLETDPLLIDKLVMVDAFREAWDEVIEVLKSGCASVN